MKKLIRDTLMKKRGNEYVWSKSNLTMASAWFVVVGSYLYALLRYGFNETAFGIMVGVALGAKLSDSWSKKIHTEPPIDGEKTN